MPHAIDSKFDALYVEGPDDGAVVNALVERTLGVDIAAKRLIRVGGGAEWALREFEALTREARPDARVGVIVDRDSAQEDKWPAVRAILGSLGSEVAAPTAAGAVVAARFGVWMWPDNVSHGDLEDFLAGIVPGSTLLSYAGEACRVARIDHAAEYEPEHERKATLKVRSIWRDASAAGGYGHLVRRLALQITPASAAFQLWFGAIFMT